jgi:hypothetical protein
MAAQPDAERHAGNVYLGVIGADEEELDEESGLFGPFQNVHLRRVRHDGFEGETASCRNALLAPNIGNSLGFPYARVFRTFQSGGDIVCVDIFAEVNLLVPQPAGQSGFSSTIRPSYNQQEGLFQTQKLRWKSSGGARLSNHGRIQIPSSAIRHVARLRPGSRRRNFDARRRAAGSGTDILDPSIGIVP